jgi:hypothetical protein
MAGTLVANTINTDTGLFSTNNAYSGIAKAWCNFNGTSGAINGSFNVSSVTRNGTGDYTLNFTTAMANSTYAVNVSAPAYSTTNGTALAQIYGSGTVGSAGTQSTTQIRVAYIANTTYFDPAMYYVSIFSA